MSAAAALVTGYAVDVALGDPHRWHPVAGFGQLAAAVEDATYAPTRRRGAGYAIALVASAALSAELAVRLSSRLGLGRAPAFAAVTWAALGGRSLITEARGLATHVDHRDLEAARDALPALCGRDAAGLEASELCRAAVESVAENTSDAVVGALLWGALAGPGGIAAYRAANTIDAMVGHHSERYEAFGWAAARLDDVLNWPAARLSAGLTALCAPIVGGSPMVVWHVVRKDGGAHPSPNAGRVEAAFSGALGVQLGGPLAYGGHAVVRPLLGDGHAPTTRDVHRAARLSLAVGALAATICALLGAARSAR